MNNVSKIEAQKAVLTLPNGQTHEFPILQGSTGPDVLDIRKLYAETGYFTYDPGYTSTASCESGLTFIDGEQGVLSHRGYAIEELAEKAHIWKSAICCFTANCRHRRNLMNLIAISRITAWYMSSYCIFTAASAVTRIRCRLWSALSAHYPPSITTRLILTIPSSAVWRLTV